MAKQENKAPNLIPDEEKNNEDLANYYEGDLDAIKAGLKSEKVEDKDKDNEDMANYYEGDLEAVKAGLENEAGMNKEALNKAVDAETEALILSGKSKIEDIKNTDGVKGEDVDDAEGIIASSEMMSRRLREEIQEKENELEEKRKKLEEIESGEQLKTERVYDEDELVNKEGKAREKMLSGEATDNKTDDISPDNGDEAEIPLNGPDTPSKAERVYEEDELVDKEGKARENILSGATIDEKTDNVSPDSSDEAEIPQNGPDTSLQDGGGPDDITPSGDKEAEIPPSGPETPPSPDKPSAELGLLNSVTKGFSEFNVDLNAFKTLDPETFEKMKKLSPGQQLLLLENLKQLTLGRIQEEAREKFGDDIDKSGFLGKVWKGISKHYQIAAAEKEKAKEIMAGGIDMHKDILKQLVNGMSNYGPDVEMKDGQLEIQFVNSVDMDKLSPEDKQQIMYFNRAANDMSQIPDEWGYKSASRKQKEAYNLANAGYKYYKAKVLEIKKSQSSGKEAMLYMNDVDAKVKMNRFLNAHPEVGDALQNTKDQKAFARVWKDIVAERGMYMAAGYLTRTATISLLGLAAAPLAAAGMGAIAARLRSKAELMEQEGLARKGHEEYAFDHKLNLNNTKGKPGEGADQNKSKYKDYVDAEYLHESLDFIVNSLKDPEIIKNPKARRELALNLEHELSEIEGKLVEGTINYGQRETTEKENEVIHLGRVANQYALMQKFTEAQVFLNNELREGTISGVDMDKVDAEYFRQLKSETSENKNAEMGIEQFLKEQGEHISAEQEKYLRAQMKRGALFGAGLAAAGLFIRDLTSSGGFSHNYLFHHGEAPAGSGATAGWGDNSKADVQNSVSNAPKLPANPNAGGENVANELKPTHASVAQNSLKIAHENPSQGPEIQKGPIGDSMVDKTSKLNEAVPQRTPDNASWVGRTSQPDGQTVEGTTSKAFTPAMQSEAEGMPYGNFRNWCRIHNFEYNSLGNKTHEIIDSTSKKVIGIYNSGTKHFDIVDTPQGTVAPDNLPEAVAQPVAGGGVATAVEQAPSAGGAAEVAKPIYEEHLEYQGGKHVWGEAAKQLEGRFKDLFNKLGSGDPNSAEALKTYNIDRLKDTVATALKSKDPALLEKYGLKGISNIDNVSKAQLQGMNWDKIAADTFDGKGLTQGLSSDELESIFKNNHTLQDYFAKHPGVPRTSENYDAVIRGDDPSIVHAPTTVENVGADAGPAQETVAAGSAPELAAVETTGPTESTMLDKAVDAMVKQRTGSQAEGIYQWKFGPFKGSQIQEWPIMQNRLAVDVINGKFGDSIGGLDAAEIHNREQLQALCVEAQKALGRAVGPDEKVIHLVNDYNRLNVLNELGAQSSEAGVFRPGMDFGTNETPIPSEQVPASSLADAPKAVEASSGSAGSQTVVETMPGTSVPEVAEVTSGIDLIPEAQLAKFNEIFSASDSDHKLEQLSKYINETGPNKMSELAQNFIRYFEHNYATDLDTNAETSLRQAINGIKTDPDSLEYKNILLDKLSYTKETME